MKNYIIEDYALENYFNAMNPVSHFKKKKDMTDEERTARRKKFQKILKIGIALGAVTTLVIFGPEIMTALAPVFPAMKAALKGRGIDTKNLKVGEVAEKFHTEVVGKELPTDTDKAKKGMAVAKNILGWFAGAKKRRDEGTATPFEKKMLESADKVTDQIAKTAESDAAKTIQNFINDGTADQGKVAENSFTKDLQNANQSATGGMDIKKYLPIAVIALAILFFMKK